MKRFIPALALPFISTSLAWAGFVQPQVVTVDEVAMMAQGDQWTARNSSSDLEYIGCGVRYFDDGAGGVTTFGFCQARDAAGLEGMCVTERTDLVNAMASTSAFAFITFNWNVDGECTRIGNSTQSLYLPAFKTKN